MNTLSTRSIGGLAALLLLCAMPSLAFASYPEIIYYTFNEGSGNQTENLANPGQGNTQAPFINNVTWVSPGKFGDAINTSAGYVDSGWNTDISDSFTIECWLRIGSTGSLEYFAGDSSHNSFRMFTGGVAGQGIYVRGGGLTDTTTSTNVQTGDWIHFAFVYDASASETRLYLDGNLEATVTGQSSLQTVSSSTFTVGTHNGSSLWAGDIDEFRFWSDARTQSEIQATMNSELGELQFEDLATNEMYSATGATADIGSFEAGVPDSVTLQASSAIPNISVDITGVTVSNDVNVSNVSVSPTSATGITDTNTEDFVVDFEPVADGPFSFTLEFDHTGTMIPSPFELHIDGYAGPQVTVEDGSGEIIEEGETWTPGGSYSSQQPSTVSFEIHSTGSDDLDVTQIDTTNHNNVVVNSVNPNNFTGGNELAPSTNASVTVDFTPQAPGVFEFDVVIDSNDGGSPYSFTVRDGSVFGTGIYTIDNDPAATPNFTDIGDAIQALHTYGVNGTVIFEIYDDGSGYQSTDDYVFAEIPGASSSNTITLRAASGHRPRIIGAGAPTNYTFYLDPYAGIAISNNATGIRLQGLEFDVDGDTQGLTFYSSSVNDPINNIIVDGCYFHSSSGPAISGYGLANRLNNIDIRNCWFWNNDGERVGTSTSTISSRGTVSIVRWQGGDFRHNTIFANSDEPAVYYNFLTSRYLDRFENNIVVYYGDNEIVGRGGSVDYGHAEGNVYWGPNASAFHTDYSDFGSWQGTGFDAHGLYADPLMRDPANGNLRLAFDSPAKDAAPTSLVQRDIFGTFRPVGMGPDIGAEEISPVEPGIGLRTEAGLAPRHGGTVELDQFGENVPLSYTLYVINERGGTLNLTGSPLVDITNLDEATASIVSQPQSTQLGAGETAAFEVEITATGPIGQSALVELSIESDDADFSTFQVELTGEIVPPQPRVAIEREPGETISSFGGVDEIATLFPIEREREIVYTIRNVGSAPLDLTGSPLVDFPSHNGLANAPTLLQQPAATIDVQDETTFVIGVLPTSAAFSFGMQVPNSDPDIDRGDYSFVVQGTAGPLPIARLEQAEVDFGTARATSDVNAETIVVQNEGSGELQVTGVKVLDGSSSWRLASADPPLPLHGSSILLDPAGGEQDTLELVLEFAPRSEYPEPLEATLEIESNDPENPLLVVTMTGTAASPPAEEGDEGCAIGSGQATPWYLLLALGLLVAIRRRLRASAPLPERSPLYT